MRFCAPKEGWGVGPWNNEPDDYGWNYKGYPCAMWRNLYGVWCGYTVIDQSLIKKYRDSDLESARCEYDHIPVSCHGSLTFGSTSDVIDKIYSENTNSDPKEHFWIGFDCHHSGDLSPAMISFDKIREFGNEKLAALHKELQEMRREERNIYRDFAFAKAEVESIVDQLIELEK